MKSAASRAVFASEVARGAILQRLHVSAASLAQPCIEELLYDEASRVFFTSDEEPSLASAAQQAAL